MSPRSRAPPQKIRVAASCVNLNQVKCQPAAYHTCAVAVSLLRRGSVHGRYPPPLPLLRTATPVATTAARTRAAAGRSRPAEDRRSVPPWPLGGGSCTGDPTALLH